MFLLVYLAVSVGVNALFFIRIRVLLLNKGLLQWVVMAAIASMILLPIASYALDRNGHDLPARLAAYGGFCWMGFIFIAFVISLLMTGYDCLAWVTRLTSSVVTQIHLALPPLCGKVPALAMLAGACMLCITGAISARAIRIERLYIETDKLPPSVERLTIAQISDVHLGLILREGFLNTLVD